MYIYIYRYIYIYVYIIYIYHICITGVVPFISVDGAWCYHWQMCCDIDEGGLSNMCS